MDRYPHSIVWTPLPILTWIIPIIGHTGIADSEGVIYDFGGSYYIAVDNLTFGRPTKFARLDPSKAESRDWDSAIERSATKFRNQQHNIITNNCHSHVADTLNEMRYNGRSNYSQLDVFWMITFQSKHIGLRGFLLQWGPCLVLLSILAVVLFIL